MLAALASHPLTLTPGFLSLLHLLRAKHKQVFLVTGGFIQMLAHLLPTLHIPPSHVYANHLLFTHAGHYAGFDPTQPTSASGGKAKAITALMAQYALSRVVMVGDGVTDVEARPPAMCMVGYGGVVVREAVRKKADWFIGDWAQLMNVYESEEERAARERRMWAEAEVEEERAKIVQRTAAAADFDERKQPTPPSAATSATVTAARTDAVDGTTERSDKKARKPRSDKGVKRGKRKSTGENQPQTEQPQHTAVQQMSKEQKAAEAAKAALAVDAAMAEWSALSSPATWR